MRKLLFTSIICIAFTGCNSKSTSTTNSATEKLNNLTNFFVVRKFTTTNTETNYLAVEIENYEDTILTQTIEDAISSDHSIKRSNKEISIAAKDGTVTLSGDISSKLQRNRIIKRVRNIPGVESINNELIVSNN